MLGALFPPNGRYAPLVALTLSGDLLDHAKDLFVGAKRVEGAMLTPSGQQGGDFHGWLAGSPWLITGQAGGSPIRDEPCHSVAHGGG